MGFPQQTLGFRAKNSHEDFTTSSLETGQSFLCPPQQRPLELLRRVATAVWGCTPRAPDAAHQFPWSVGCSAGFQGDAAEAFRRGYKRCASCR